MQGSHSFFLLDYGLNLLLKIARKDFIYWIRVDNLMASIVLSLFARVVFKVIVDFTGVVQYRHPYEVGGLQYTLAILLTFIGSFAAVHIYSEMYVPSIDDKVPLNVNYLYALVAGLTTIAVASAAVALKTMNRKYWPTFYSTKTGWQISQSFFLYTMTTRFG